MAKLATKFDATAHDTTQREFSGEDLPAGIFKFEIEASDVVETGPEERRTGSGMKYTSNVIAPEEFAGRKFFGFINLENANSQAQEIGQREFASLCRAVGVSEVDDTEDLHFLSYTVKLGLGRPSKKVHPVGHEQAGQPMYPARMEVKRYYFEDEGNVPEPAIDDNQPAPAPTPAVPTPAANDNRPAVAQAGQRRPWGSKAA